MPIPDIRKALEQHPEFAALNEGEKAFVTSTALHMAAVHQDTHRAMGAATPIDWNKLFSTIIANLPAILALFAAISGGLTPTPTPTPTPAPTPAA